MPNMPRPPVNVTSDPAELAIKGRVPGAYLPPVRSLSERTRTAHGFGERTLWQLGTGGRMTWEAEHIDGVTWWRAENTAERAKLCAAGWAGGV